MKEGSEGSSPWEDKCQNSRCSPFLPLQPSSSALKKDCVPPQPTCWWGWLTSRKGVDSVWAQLSNHENIPEFSRLFPAQIHFTVPYKLLGRKLTLPQPKPAYPDMEGFLIGLLASLNIHDNFRRTDLLQQLWRNANWLVLYLFFCIWNYSKYFYLAFFCCLLIKERTKAWYHSGKENLYILKQVTEASLEMS